MSGTPGRPYWDRLVQQANSNRPKHEYRSVIRSLADRGYSVKSISRVSGFSEAEVRRFMSHGR